MGKRKENKKPKRYGIWQENTKRHGLCWCFEVRILDADGKLRRRAGSGFKTKSECEDAVAALRLAARERKFGLTRPEPVKHTTISEAVQAYIKILKAKWESKHGAQYAKRNTGQINALQNWTEFAGPKRRVDSLTKDDFVFWMQHEAKRGLQPSSIARRINSIRAALNHARETKPDLINFRIPKMPVGKEGDIQRMRILDENEVQKLSKVLASKPDWRDAYDFFRIALGCGGRFDEMISVVEREDRTAAGIKWTDINRHFKTLRLFSHKTGKERTLYVPAVVEILLQRKADGLGDDIHAFTCRDHWIRAVFKKASKMCGLTYGQRIKGAWTVHDLRHTCLTNLLHSGVDLATVRDFAGHHSIVETSKYVHPTAKSKQLAASASSILVDLASYELSVSTSSDDLQK